MNNCETLFSTPMTPMVS